MHIIAPLSARELGLIYSRWSREVAAKPSSRNSETSATELAAPTVAAIKLIEEILSSGILRSQTDQTGIY